MIGYSYRRSPGGRRYSPGDRVAARLGVRESAPATLTGGARSTMTDRDGIEAVVDATFEVESNRLRRPTVTKFYVNGVEVAPTIGATSTLSNGRQSPSHRFAVADAAVADSAVTFDPQAGDEPPVGIPSTCWLTAPNGDAAAANPAPTVRPRWETGSFLGAQLDPGRVALPSAEMTKPDGFPYSNAWVLDAGGAASLADVDRELLYLEPESVKPTRYVVPPSGQITFQVVCYVAANGQAKINPTLWMQVEGEGSPRWGGFWPTIVDGRPAGGSAQDPRRIAVPITFTVPAGSIITSVRPHIDVASTADTTATRVELTGLQVYVGEAIRPDSVGRLTAAPAQETIIEQTWTDSRRVNRVDVSGDARAGQITAATVQVRTAPAGAWTYAGRGQSSGRLSVELTETFDAYGVRVIVEETTSGDSGVVWVTEVDPQYVRDVSEDVVSLDVEISRETDPGTATSPVGNYQASELTIELEDTDGDWNPAKNASLDVGHRIEVALGVRYRNFSTNPVADKDLTDWQGYSTQEIRRVVIGAGLDDDAPAETGVANTQGPGADPVLYPPAVYSPPGYYRRVGAWTRYEGDPAGYSEACAVVWNAIPGKKLSGGAEITPAVDRPRVYAADGWQYVELGFIMPAGYNYVGIRFKGTSGAASTVPQTVYVTRCYNGAHDGDSADDPVIEFEELLPAGVYYSEPYDTASDAQTVTIRAVDKLARLKSTEVAEGVRLGQRVDTVVGDLALRLLDFDDDQVRIDATTGAYVVPYAYPSGDLGTYLADLAKATISTLYVDPLEVLVIEPRAAGSDVVVEEIRADNALISFKRPPGYDSTTSIVTVNASPLAPSPTVEELWTMPSGGISIAPASSRTLECPFSAVPSINAFVTGMIADGTVNITATTFYADRAVVVLSNPHATETRVVADLKVRGTPLVETPIATTIPHAPSVDRYGPRTLEVAGKLIQTQAQTDYVASVLLETFRALDDDGVRRIPDLSIDSLALLHLTPGDRVLVQHPDRGVGSEYVLLSRRIGYSEGAITFADTRLREDAGGNYGTADVSIADDVFVTAY